MPNFADPRWHQQRRDSELRASILDGKGDGMPPFHGIVSEEQADELVSFTRAFASHQNESKEEPNDTLSNGFEEARAVGSVEKLIAWLGKFHPPLVSFPIALLVAAALAELLGIATSKPVFGEHSRYCLWLGALSAVGAGGLGWFLAGFQLSDTSWVLTTHRWLGTGTIAWSLAVLTLGEASRRLNRRGARLAFRVTLFGGAGLVLAAGFLGGALVFGLDHYAWPP